LIGNLSNLIKSQQFSSLKKVVPIPSPIHVEDRCGRLVREISIEEPYPDHLKPHSGTKEGRHKT